MASIPSSSPPASPPAASSIENFKSLPWPERLAIITRMMREVSSATNPQQMVDTYGTWVQTIAPVDRFVSLSRRDLLAPRYRITRSGLWEDQGLDINPWKTKLPVFDHGLLGALLYAGEPRIINDFTCPQNDPGRTHLDGFRSLRFMPLYEDGMSVNAVVSLHREPGRFEPEDLPMQVWLSNLFGRATKNLVLSGELREAYEALDRELKVVADLQRSLLPIELPKTPGLSLAAHYQTSTQAGGDYYDFFELEDGRLGILIADVSGHGSPAAVMMAVTHSIAHTRDEPPTPPHEVLSFINRRLCARYTTNGTFVTAFYGIYDPRDHSLRYCNAGHNPPIVRSRTGSAGRRLDENGGLPLGILVDEPYAEAVTTLEPGDVLVLYTDGITEARAADPEAEMFGLDRLESTVRTCAPDARAVVEQTIRTLNDFTDFAPATDDRTLVVVRVEGRG